MNGFATLLRMLLVCWAASLPVQSATGRVLSDFRIDGAKGRIKSGSELSPKIRRQVLSAVFPTYLTSETACNRENEQTPIDDAELEVERKTGQIVPAIEAFAGAADHCARFISCGEPGVTWGVKLFDTTSKMPALVRSL